MLFVDVNVAFVNYDLLLRLSTALCILALREILFKMYRYDKFSGSRTEMIFHVVFTVHLVTN
jgi:hypothetical protein